MAIEIVDCEQGSTEWTTARLGLVTASKFSTVMASGRGGGESKTRLDYMCDLAGEIITGNPTETYSNQFMERGKAQEDEARKLYSFMRDADPTRVGFVKNGLKGCSPDSLLGKDGALEIKTTMARLLIKILTRGEYPPEHRHQCQGTLLVTERDWIDIAIYCPKMPLFVERIYRDEPLISAISAAVDEFNSELYALVQRIRRHG